MCAACRVLGRSSTNTVELCITRQQQKLTSIDNLAKQILSTQEVPRRAVPPAILELMLTLGDGHVGTFRNRR